MAQQRGRGEGTISLRGDGRWEARISLPGGKRRCLYGKTCAEAAKKLREAQKDLDHGMLPPDGRTTVGEYLREWLESVRSSLDYTSARHYDVQIRKQLIRKQLTPHIGRVPLAKLTPYQLNALYAKLLEDGYSRTTLRLAHRLMKQALTSAVKLELLTRNVALLATPPKAGERNIVILTREEARRLLDAAKGTRMEAMWVLALATGMRMGELLALEWRDFDFKKSAVQVSKTLSRRPHADGGLTVKEPKTRFSRRTITFNEHVAEALKRHRARQAQERLDAGPLWVDQDVVFCNEIGWHMQDAVVRFGPFRRLLRDAKLPHMRPHDLRHTAATLLLEDGVSPLTVSKMLGHSSVALTLDLYGHVTPRMNDTASEAMSRILFG